MMKFFDEFKEFIAKGNVMDMAVGVVIGGAFKGIVDSLVKDIINPFVAFCVSLISKATKSVAVGMGAEPDTASKAMDMANWKIPGTDILIGSFIGAVINFLIMAFVIFCLVKAVNKMREKLVKEKEEAAPAGPSQEEILAEIRDLLKEKV